MLRRNLLKKVFVIFVLVLASFVILIADTIFNYSSAPLADTEKDCDFIFPNDDNESQLITAEGHLPDPPFSLTQPGGFINDASCLNKTAIYGVLKVRNIADIQNALQFARDNHLKVTVAGQRHSMGGQSFIKDGLVLDMRDFNQVIVSKENFTLTAESGATWAQIQNVLDADGLSVKAMQSINVPTVGGTLSVNAHGIAHDPGQIAPTVKWLRILLSNGEIKTASFDENPDLFRLAIGGYGLFGVILDAELEIVANEVYEWKTKYLNYTEFPEYYLKNVEGNRKIGLFYGRLSVSPGSYLTEAAFHTYEKRAFDGAIPVLKPLGDEWFVRSVLNFSKTGGFGRRVRWGLEKYVEPKIYPCLTRSQAMVQENGCLVTRNHEMADSMGYLKSRFIDTNILQEYFIPPAKMTEFIDGLRKLVGDDRGNLLNVTVRFVHEDTVTALPYATQDMFAFVLYFNQKLNEAESRRMQKITADLIDLSLRLSGTFYLPYQLFYSKQQLRQAYPEIDSFFAQKKKHDPIGLFTNKLYEKYSA